MDTIDITAIEQAQNPFTKAIKFKVIVTIKTSEPLEVSIKPDVLGTWGYFVPSESSFVSTQAQTYTRVFKFIPKQTGQVRFSFKASATSPTANYVDSFYYTIQLNNSLVRVPPKPGYYGYIGLALLGLVIAAVGVIAGLKRLLVWVKDTWLPGQVSKQETTGV